MSLRWRSRVCMVWSMAVLAPDISGAREVRRPLTRDEVMTAPEVAQLLHLPVSTVYLLAARGEIPSSRFGRAYRFLRPRIEALLES
jgi:excisionase family DNA binding protein